jgi:hypothetical protein
MRRSLSFLFFVIALTNLHGQEREMTITETIDELTSKWDTEAEILKTYDGMREYCKVRQHRVNTIELVKQIHHYDSLLYKTVKTKFDASKDDEAQATLKDIKKLEDEYTTKGFLDFIHKECSTFNEIENNYGRSKGKQYQKEVAKMEKELTKYVIEITSQIDLIDEHIHHLDGI